MIRMSEQKNQKIFKTVFGGGYQKSDVNEYIESMQAQFLSIEQTLKNTINHQRAELDALRRQNDEAIAAKESAAQLKAELDGTAEKLGTACAELESCKVTCISAEAARATAEASAAAARAETEKMTAERDAAQAELEQLKAQYEQLLSEKQALQETVDAAAAEQEFEAACEIPSEQEAAAAPAAEPMLPADYEAMKLKAEQYDRMSAHIGSIMLKANAGAEDVMSRAKADADAMVARVNEMLTETRVRAQSTADHLIADVSQSLSEISRGCKEEIALDLEELRVALRTLESTVSNKYQEINRKLDYTKEEMEQTAGAIIRSATEPVTADLGEKE